MKRIITYIMISVIFIIEIITWLSGYRFINTMTYFLLNGLLIFILTFLLKKKLLSYLPVKIFFILLICFAFILSDRTFVIHDRKSNSSLIIQEQSGFNDYIYTFYKKKFIFFKEPVSGTPIVSNKQLDINKSFNVTWIDNNTVKLSPLNKNSLTEQTIFLDKTYK